MIGRVYRGAKVAGLVRYLFGPGRHNEHLDPRLVAAWDATSPGDLVALTPAGEGTGPRYYGRLVAELEAPMAYAERLPAEPVWHCPLRVADTDRTLSDAEWGVIAADLMDRTGLAPKGDDGGVRWVAVRHDDVSIHVVATLARQDGGRAHPAFDYRRVREACLAAEAEYGLVATAPINGTAIPATTRPETEKAERRAAGGPLRAEGARVTVRREVRAQAGAAEGETEFFNGLRRAGLIVSFRHSTLPGQEEEVTGYSVGVRGDVDRDGRQVLFGGGRLAPELTLPKLRDVWATSAPEDPSGIDGLPAAAPTPPHPILPPPGRPPGVMANGRAQALREGAEKARELAAAVSAGGLDDGSVRDVLGVTGEGIAVVARSVEGPIRGPLVNAAASYERAGRLTRQAPRQAESRRPADLAVSRAGRDMRKAVRAVARAGTVRGSEETGAALELVAALLLLAAAAAELHRTRGDLHSAAAARAAGEQLTGWQARTQSRLTGAGAGRGAVTQPPAYRPPQTPPPTRGR